ncbi:hypothetical protein A3C18_02310 [Candidatus Kaiserbacteria bacterium RIFCSPHIGHO2_02_FULL_54_11b]|uniref:DNA-binding protein n=2 Tax=Candidatus Kaiseribacteriota TaxID=1752734 RepID=A0A1F6CJY8_9BACT|nr:MAG: hypothetical protein A2704_01115 [Candidatus Kaiserbacteria bacterium RIFCSPHIGHO2_01_FULL_54_36b]OGG65048.1 MAG: hypothetical protein A3C18_02310 [Candidatus Kaiserbacteria bacterium RIFCSPHIGHO2_02_FULL_54_11b]
MKEAIYTQKITLGSKAYFFDVREGGSGNRYLQVTESRVGKDGERIRNNIAIFKDHLEEFRRILKEVSEKV